MRDTSRRVDHDRRRPDSDRIEAEKRTNRIKNFTTTHHDDVLRRFGHPRRQRRYVLAGMRNVKKCSREFVTHPSRARPPPGRRTRRARKKLILEIYFLYFNSRARSRGGTRGRGRRRRRFDDVINRVITRSRRPKKEGNDDDDDDDDASQFFCHDLYVYLVCMETNRHFFTNKQRCSAASSPR